MVYFCVVCMVISFKICGMYDFSVGPLMLTSSSSVCLHGESGNICVILDARLVELVDISILD